MDEAAPVNNEMVIPVADPYGTHFADTVPANSASPPYQDFSEGHVRKEKDGILVERSYYHHKDSRGLYLMIFKIVAWFSVFWSLFVMIFLHALDVINLSAEILTFLLSILSFIIGWAFGTSKPNKVIK